MATQRKRRSTEEAPNQDVFSTWFDHAADWADRHDKDVTFARDEYEGWFATVHFADASGPYSATVDQFRKKQKESGPSYRDRVFDAFRSAVEEAYRKRTLMLAKRPMRLPVAA